ncbi:MAG: hypothetical protein IKO14_00210 [Oscillibacter sp.]|nr:hypothetical protein [Oscillibacter sp.]
MKRVLWISRHEMTREQRADLERVLGDPVELTVWAETVEDVSQLRPAVEAADVVAAVLPPNLLGELVNLAGEKMVLRAVTLRIPLDAVRTLPDGRREREFAYVHQYWEQVLRLRLETRRL